MNAGQVIRVSTYAMGMTIVLLAAGFAQAGAATNCCTVHDTPGCDDPECEAIVCGEDKFCCDIDWDKTCVEIAMEQCGACVGCGTSAAGNCCEANSTPFCSDPKCCEAVCAIDSYCCDVQWDAICAAEAVTECPLCPLPPQCGDLDAGECCDANNTTSCNDAECCDTICAQDPFCCDIQWDDLCAEQAGELCVQCMQCGSSGAGRCCQANGTPFCNNAACCETVCAINKFCCDVEWDSACADLAAEQCDTCSSCGNPDSGNCCTSNGTPGCNNADCCEAVCANDPFCCDVQWDLVCAVQAFFDRACSCESN